MTSVVARRPSRPTRRRRRRRCRRRPPPRRPRTRCRRCGRRRAVGHEDGGRQPEQPGHAGHGPAVVAVGGGHQPQRAQSVGDDRGQVVERRPRGLAAEPVAQHPVGRPRGAEDLERRQPEPARLVLDQHPARRRTTPASAGSSPQRRRRVAGEALVEGVHGRSRAGRRRAAATVRWLTEQAGGHGRGSTRRSAGSRVLTRERLQQFVDALASWSSWPRLHAQRGADVEVGDHPHLLAALREELDVTSPKDGCSPSGQCGCCTVLVDGKAGHQLLDRPRPGRGQAGHHPRGPRRRASASATRPPSPRPVRCSAASARRASSCARKYLVDKDGPALTRDKAARHLGGHLCRCTGYHPILDAVDLLATGEEVPVPWPEARHATEAATAPTWGVGSRNSKYEAGELALGDKDYVDDMRVPGMLHAAVVLAEHARADVLAIDTAAAAAVPGVVRRAHRRRRARRAADRADPPRLAGVHPRWAGARRTRATCSPSSSPTTGPPPARAAELVAVDYAPLSPFADALAALDSTEPAVWQVGEPDAPTCCRGPPTPAATTPTA